LSSNNVSQEKKPEIAWFFDKMAVVIAMIIIGLIIGLSYLAIEWTCTGHIQDGLFIGLLLGATLLLLQGMRAIFRYVVNNIIAFFAFALEKKNYEEISARSKVYCHDIFNSRNMILSGILYGLVVGSSIFFMNIWKEEGLLKIFLFLFLFIINFVTGIGFYGMVKFFVNSWKIGKFVKVDLWQRVNPTMSFFQRVKRDTALIAIAYISICISSIFFSGLRYESLSIGYSIFAGIVVLLVFVLPEIPIRKKIMFSKKKALAAINNQLQSEFQQALDEAKSADKEIDLSKIERLIILREKIHKISAWPFGLHTIGTAISVIIITILPIVLEYILKRIFIR
jgi:hypothetical protein